jgi:hypothetical protein
MKRLDESVILELMREEWSKKLQLLAEEVELIYKMKINGKTITPIDSGLHVVSRDEKRTEYTVDEVGPDHVVLIGPDKTRYTIGTEELENNYELDK